MTDTGLVLETTEGSIATLEHWTENRLERKPEEAYETLVAKMLRDFTLLQSEVKRLTDKDEFRVRELITAGMPASAAPLLAAKDRWQERAMAAEAAIPTARDDEAGKIEAWLQSCANQPIVPNDPVPVEVQRGSRETFAVIARAISTRSYRTTK